MRPIMSLLLSSALTLFCLSCGARTDSELRAEQSSPANLAAEQRAVLPDLPGGREASGLTETLIYGAATELRSANVLDNGNAVDISPPAAGSDWALYRFNTANPLDSVSVQLDSPGSSAWVGLSNYTKGSWEFHGPYNDRHTLLLDSGDYLSPAGNLYCVVLATGSAATVSALSVRTLNPANLAPTAVLQADSTQGDAALLVSFDASGSGDADGQIIEYAWDWDGNGGYEEISDSPAIDHLFPLPGIFSVKLRVTDDQFARASDTVDITVNVPGNTPPVASYSATPDSGNFPLPVSFDASASNDPDGSIVRYDWDLDGDSMFEVYDGGATAAHVYSSSGLVSTQLRVTDNLGSQHIVGHDITISTPGNAAPAAGFSVAAQQDILPLGLSYLFDASGSSDSDGSLVQYDWDWDGDGNWDSLDGPAAPIHVYGMLGVFRPKLRVLDDGGATDIAQQTVYSPSCWNSFNGQPGSATRRSAVQGPLSNNLLWSYTAPDAIYSSPAIGADGTIYFGCYDNKVYAVKPNGTPTPDLKWSFTTGDKVRSSPAIGPDGTVYVGSDDTKLYALADNGSSTPSLLWSFTTTSTIQGSPCIGPDGTVYIGSGDGKFYALADNGSSTPTVKWSYTTGGEIDGGAAIGPDGTVYVASYDHLVYAFQDNGSDTPTVRWTFDTGEWNQSTPAIDANGIVYVASLNGYIYALEDNGTSTPDLKWSYSTSSNINSSPAIGAGGNVYIGGMDKWVYALKDNGTAIPDLKWAYQTSNYVNSSPAVGPDGTVYVGSVDGAVYAFHGNGSATPAVTWFYNSGFAVWSSPAIGPDGTMYIGNHAGLLMAFGQ